MCFATLRCRSGAFYVSINKLLKILFINTTICHTYCHCDSLWEKMYFVVVDTTMGALSMPNTSCTGMSNPNFDYPSPSTNNLQVCPSPSTNNLQVCPSPSTNNLQVYPSPSTKSLFTPPPLLTTCRFTPPPLLTTCRFAPPPPLATCRFTPPPLLKACLPLPLY